MHDVIIVNDDLEVAYRELEEFIFGKGKFAGAVGEKQKTQEQGAGDAEKAGVSVQD